MANPPFDPVPAPLFSVVIPTRDRPHTLPHAVATVLAQDFRDFELLVIDNCSAVPAERLLAAQSGPHLRILVPPRRLPMHENWEFGLAATRGRYILFIGDDDGLMPDGLRLAAGLLRGSEAELLCWLPHDYKWPDAAMAAGQLRVQFGALAGPLDLAAHLQRHYALSGPETYLTSIYHGLVSRQLVDRIRQRQGGRYFVDPVCDIESEILNALYGRSALVSQRPVSMNGHSGGSNGGANGRPDRLTAAYDRFAAEAGLAPHELAPCGVALPLYHASIVAGCLLRVKARHFPADDRLAPDPERLLRWIAAGSGLFGAERPPGLAEGIRALARALDIVPQPIPLPPARPPQRPSAGLSRNALGQPQLAIEAGQAGVADIAAAVRLAQSMLPPIAAQPRAAPLPGPRG